MSHVLLAGRGGGSEEQAVLHSKNLNAGRYLQTFLPSVFIPAMLIHTIDFYHFIPLLLTLILAGATRSAQSKTYWLHFLWHFSADLDEIGS